MEKKEKSVFNTLLTINVNEHVEVKKSGNTELSYLSWPYAWAEVKSRYPDATYTVKMFDGRPFIYDENTGYMVFTSVTIAGETLDMWLPVMDGANKAMKAKPYKYVVAKYEYNQATRRREKVGEEEKTVEAATMFDINRAIMRCLVKNFGAFGAGLYIYSGDDLPPSEKLFCAECGAEIKGVGKHSAEYVAELTIKKYGAQLCGTCAERRKAAMTAAETKKEETV